MTNNELLLAISDLMDKKLEVNSRYLENKITENLESKIAENSKILEDKITHITLSIENNILPRLQSMELSIENDILPRLQSMELSIENDILPRLQSMELSIENSILPRLQNIESCYTDTYKRYQENNEKMELFFQDISLIKQVLTGHSERLEKLA